MNNSTTEYFTRHNQNRDNNLYVYNTNYNRSNNNNTGDENKNKENNETDISNQSTKKIKRRRKDAYRIKRELLNAGKFPNKTI